MQNNVVLIVDDSELIVSRIRQMLEEIEQPSLVLSANSYQEALLVLGRIKPTIVITDINLPDKNGFELLAHIKRTFPATQVLISSNQAFADYKKLSLSLGADYFIDKSNEFEQIPKILASLLKV